jgi:predicted dehydrogenase
VKGLVVGLGSIGRRHARNWAALNLGPVATCRQLNRTLPEPLGISAAEYADLDAALERERPDAVLVTNPTSMHLETARAALDAGAHVLIEKPLGHTLEGVDALLRRAIQSGRRILVGYNLRFHPGLARLRSLARDGAIGRINTARAEAGEYLPNWHPWEDYRTSYAGRRGLGGGAVLTFSHELDALCWVLGAPRRVSGLTARRGGLEIDTEDVAEITLEFASGALGSVHVDYLRWPPRRSLELIGDRGILRWDYTVNRLEHYSATSSQWRVEDGDPRFERNDMYLDELRHFAACVRGEVEQPLIDGEQGAAVLVVALAALESAATGRVVDLSAVGEPISEWLGRLEPA